MPQKISIASQQIYAEFSICRRLSTVYNSDHCNGVLDEAVINQSARIWSDKALLEVLNYLGGKNMNIEKWKQFEREKTGKYKTVKNYLKAQVAKVVRHRGPKHLNDTNSKSSANLGEVERQLVGGRRRCHEHWLLQRGERRLPDSRCCSGKCTP